MLLEPLRGTRRNIRVHTQSVVAPVGGWNARDPVGSMKPDQAVVLDNWFPSTADISVRTGHTTHKTGFASTVETLMVWGGPTGTKMLAASGGSIYDASASGAVGTALATGFASNRWQWANMGTAGGEFVVAVNGADAPINFDGTTIATTPAITGLTPSGLINVEVYRQRLFFAEQAKLGFWYLAVNAIGGAATYFDLSAYLKLGGFMMAIGTWTRDGGSGPDDLIAFMSSMGEIAVYSGTDPGNATTWGLVGVFRLGAPVGRRCMMKIAGDLVIITQDGFVSMAQALPVARSNNAAVSISYNIANAVSAAIQTYAGNFGWQGLLYPRGNQVIFNVPLSEDGQSHQYVMNPITKAWCRFTGQNAYCWALFNDQPYFGTSGSVMHADNGYTDNGLVINADALPAFNYFGNRSALKRFTMARPVMSSNGPMSPAIVICIDFDQQVPQAIATYAAPGGADWDVTDWDTVTWESDNTTRKDWQSVTGLGYCAALRVQAATNGAAISLRSIDYVFEAGGVL